MTDFKDLNVKFVNKLAKYYGAISGDSEEISYIKNHFYFNSEDQIEKVCEYLYENCEKKFGFPSIKRLKESLAVLCEESVSSGNLFVYRKCTVCNTYYPASQLICTKCYAKDPVKNIPEKLGFKNHLLSKYAKSLITVQKETPVNCLQQNIDYPWIDDKTGEIQKICSECKEWAPWTYCRHFAERDFLCKRENAEQCPCRNCCIKLRGGK